MVDGAAGDVSAIPGGLRITFGAGKSDMSPATVAALNKLGEAVAPSETAALNIYAYAAGAPDDPSTPRRLSLSRALAARAVLMSDNIASTRIYVHAMGGTPSPGPADRVDVQLAGNPSPPKDAAAK
jgi:outer membrane protein OmpA-like peptidoglycan-associated protein